MTSYNYGFTKNVRKKLLDQCSRKFNCKPFKYRSFDGSCNNLKRGHFGKSFECLTRLLPPNYASNAGHVRNSVTGGVLPSPRVVSLNLHLQERVQSNATHMLMAFGQFLDHDLSKTPVRQQAGGASLNCCENARHRDCLPIAIPRNDPFYSQFSQRCMAFVRSQNCVKCSGRKLPEQLNAITAYIDGSMIYGSSPEEARTLRLFRQGLLRTTRARNGGEILPNSIEPSGDLCSVPERNLLCFHAGVSPCQRPMTLFVADREIFRCRTIGSISNQRWCQCTSCGCDNTIVSLGYCAD